MVDENMYSDDDSNESKKKKLVQLMQGRFSASSNKSRFISINEEQVEIINKSYVEKVEADLRSTIRDLKSAQSKINQLVKAINTLSGDVKELRRQINARGRFE